MSTRRASPAAPPAHESPQSTCPVLNSLRPADSPVAAQRSAAPPESGSRGSGSPGGPAATAP
ncbi:MAG: hypothetical protein FJW20_19140 [Acidimicrobiia bacterium]|nr:hypothetical protein [Acidimicrobiia bacterium]